MAKVFARQSVPVEMTSWQEASSGLHVSDTYWGYIIKTSAAPLLPLLVGQAMCWAGGIGCLVAALGLWTLPGSSFSGDLMAIKLLGSALLVLLASLLIWFANRGHISEWHIDTARGEIREMLLSRSGRPSLLARYGFDAIGGVVIDRVSQRDHLPAGYAGLMLRLGNSAQMLPLAFAPEAELAPLRDRLGRDMIVDLRPLAARAPTVRRLPQGQAA